MIKVFLFYLVMITSLVSQSFEYKDIYFAMTKAEEKAYRASDVLEAINIFHNYMQPYIENIKENKRYKKLHRYGFLYSPLFDDCKNLNVERKLELEKSIDSAHTRFAIEIAEFNKLLAEIDFESQHIQDIEVRIYEIENEFNIQEKYYTKKKEEELNALRHELELAKLRKARLKSRLEPLREVLSGIGF